MALCKKYMDEVDAEWEAKMASEGDNKIDWPPKGERYQLSSIKKL